MGKRNDNNAKPVKNWLFETFGTYCMCCGKKFKRCELFLHHLKKWEHTHKTTKEHSGLVCDCCHKRIHNFERTNEREYLILNKSIYQFKEDNLN